MKSLRDMPMVSVEQKNDFREAALKVEADRDALAAWLDECLSAMRHASEFIDEFDKCSALALHRIEALSSRSRRLGDSLARRDARMKAEVMGERDQMAALAEERRQFIVNGVETGSIRRPWDEDDPAYSVYKSCNLEPSFAATSHDARMKAEVLEEALGEQQTVCAIEVVAANTIQHMAAEYRKQSEDES